MRPKRRPRTCQKKAGVMSSLDAATLVLSKAGKAMTCGEIMQEMLKRGYWQTHGRTPILTLYGAIFREMKSRGEAARFRKVGRGKFVVKN